MSSTVVSAGSSVSVSNSIQNLDVYGAATIASGGSVQDTIVHVGGVATIASGGSSVAIDCNQGGGFITIQSGGSAKVLNLSGTSTGVGTLTVQNGGAIIQTANIGSGGVLNVESGGSVLSAYVKPGGTLVVGSGAVLTDPILKNGGNIEFSDFKYGPGVTATFTPANAGDKTSSQGTITITDGTKTQTIKLNHWGNSDPLTAGPIGLVADSDGTAELTACFLEQSMIATPEGVRAVEEIQIGDRISAWDWERNETVVRPVIWTGKARKVVREGMPDDEAGYPVRIQKNAISDGVPYKDMLLTPEHCLFFDNKFVPVRMLVNGRTIAFDHSITSYDYFHIETEQHSVIWSDGMLTESYLDTGNRSSFTQDRTVVRLELAGREQVKEWACDAAAPLSVARETVKPLFDYFEQRAIRSGVQATAPALSLTDDSDFHLVTDKGHVIRPARHKSGHTLFMVPHNVGTVHLVSRTSRPRDVIGPFVDDRRELGLLIGEVTMFEADGSRRLDDHLVSHALAGWDVCEQTPCRWTNGNAELHLGDRQPDSIGMLSVQVLAAGPYRVEQMGQQKSAQNA